MYRDRPIFLTQREAQVLEALKASAGGIVALGDLIENIGSENTIRTNVSRLRKKLEPPNGIETIDRSGYRLDPKAFKGS